MPVEVKWHTEKEIILVHMEGDLRSEQKRYQEALHETDALIAESSRELVHIIFDMSEVEHTLPMLDAMSIMQGHDSNPRAGWVMIVGLDNPLLRMVSSITAQMGASRIKMVMTMKKAVEFLYDRDESLTSRTAGSENV
jgi:hypothetical protein